MPKDPGRRAYEVSCPCGETVRIDPLRHERRVTCRRCGNVLDVVISLDPKLKVPRISIVVPPNAVKTKGESLAIMAPTRVPSPPEPLVSADRPSSPRTRAGKTVSGVQATCACGTSFPVDDRELTTIQSCPGCGTTYHVVVKRDGKKKSAILVPQKPFKKPRPATPVEPSPAPATRGVRRPATPPPPVTEDSLGAAEFEVPGKKGRTRVSGPPASTRVPVAGRAKVRPEIPAGAQSVLCPCGETLAVRRRDLDREMPCPGCGRTLRFEEMRDPQTLAPKIRVKAD